MEIKLYDYTILDYMDAIDLGLNPDAMVKSECLTWIRRDKSGILVRDMKCDYIKNCINLIVENNWRVEWKDYLKKVLDQRLLHSRKRKFNDGQF